MKKILIAALAALYAAALSAGNINGRVTAEGRPLAGVPVSDGAVIVLTDEDGRYSIDSDKLDACVFITTPSGYVASSSDGLRPGFWQPLHLPADQEEIHDFILEKQDQSRYTVIFIADLHLSNDPQRQDLERFRTIVMPFIKNRAETAEGPVYSFNLGDFTHDIYWYEMDFDESDGLRLIQDLGYPGKMYTVMGNHDHDPSITGEDTDRRAAWRQRDCWGPGAYSVNIGDEHWVCLDNIYYINEPGKGKSAPGVNGDRSYKCILTDRQMEWLEKDLAAVSPSSRVCICTHAPLLSGSSKNGIGMNSSKQVAHINSLCSRFEGGADVFSGHIHRNDICDNASYPNLHQYALSATSGIMWMTPVDWPLYSGEGSDAGIWTGLFASGQAPVYKLETYLYGEKYFRFYDLNEVGKAYKTSKGVKLQQAKFPATRIDYSQRKWRNYVFVNYWGWRPGDRVEMYEKGRQLKVEETTFEDPVKNFSYELPRITNPYKHSRPRATEFTPHMFTAKASSAKKPVTVRIFGADGTLKYEQTFTRPRPFDPSKPEE